MKLRFFILLSATLALFASCETDDTVGLSMRPEKDAITVVVDTFMLTSSDYHVDAISAQCTDSLSMLLGDFYSAKYGATKADLLVQFAAPEDYVFPDASYNPQADSLILFVYYRQFFGSSTEPFEVSIYELNKATPSYSQFYWSNFTSSDFTDASSAQLLGNRVMTSIDYTLTDSARSSSTYTASLRYKLSDTQRDRFFNFPAAAYASNDAFLSYFKGMYLTTTFGQSTMLYVSEVDLRLFYHYTYQRNGNDTVVRTFITYPANKEVRQLNRLTHNNITSVMNRTDSVNLVKSAGGIYPKVTLPVGRIRNQIKERINDRLLSVNSAVLSLELTDIDEAKTAIPLPTYMMLIKESLFERFLTTNRVALSGDSAAVITSFNSTTKEYRFDIASMLSANIKSDQTDFSAQEDFILVPVRVVTTTSSTYMTAEPLKTLSAFTFRSAKNGYSPLRLELVYSGF